MDYAGDVRPGEAYAALLADERAALVDVRTVAEWAYVGLPDLAAAGRSIVPVEWERFPEGEPNPDFVSDLRDCGLRAGQPLYFICRSGNRSRHAAAAATRAGLGPAYNVVSGFEGPVGVSGHRDVAGWKVEGLPWKQG